MHTSNNVLDRIDIVAPGKLILTGEYAVLENAPALVAGIAVYAKAKIKKSDNSYSTFISANIGQNSLKFEFRSKNVRFMNNKEKQSFPYIRSLLNEFSFLKFENLSPFCLEIDTKDFFTESGNKYGLGSSAAATVAAALALSYFMEIDLDKKSLMQLVSRSHMKAQGEMGSGIDLAASVYGGVFCFKKSQANVYPQSLKFPHNLQWMPVWTGKSASTSELVKKIDMFKHTNYNQYTRIINQMRITSEKACIEFAEDRTDSFLHCITDYYHQMDELTQISGVPIISDEHKKLAQISMSLGAYYKPSGAGLGDFGLVFFNSNYTRQKFISALEDTPFRIVPLHLDYEGARQMSNLEGP
jgi:phosphomevalonate kinase